MVLTDHVYFKQRNQLNSGCKKSFYLFTNCMHCTYITLLFLNDLLKNIRIRLNLQNKYVNLLKLDITQSMLLFPTIDPTYRRQIFYRFSSYPTQSTARYQEMERKILKIINFDTQFLLKCLAFDA